MKAFHIVPHERLLTLLSALDIINNTQEWIRNFLTGRSQRAKVNGQHSEFANFSNGVPQVSVLDPILFSMFVCGIPDLLHSMILLFGDDAKAYDI